MFLHHLFIPFFALFTAFLFAPPIALTRWKAFLRWLNNTRLGRLLTPKLERDEISSVTILDLMAAALNTGMAIPAALRAVELSLGPQRDLIQRDFSQFAASAQKLPKFSRFRERGLDQVAASLLMGATWSEAWEDTPKKNQILCAVLAPAWEDGVAPVPLLERTSATLRLTQQSRAKEAAGRLGARLVAPLALCFLPAFLCIGVVPIVILAAQQIF